VGAARWVGRYKGRHEKRSLVAQTTFRDIGTEVQVPMDGNQNEQACASQARRTFRTLAGRDAQRMPRCCNWLDGRQHQRHEPGNGKPCRGSSWELFTLGPRANGYKPEMDVNVMGRQGSQDGLGPGRAKRRWPGIARLEPVSRRAWASRAISDPRGLMRRRAGGRPQSAS